MTHPTTLHQDEAQSITTISHNIDPRSIELIRIAHNFDAQLVGR